MESEIYNLIESTNPLLYTKIEDFDFSNPPIDPIELSKKLIETMKFHNGMGLSANQCGLPYKVFVMMAEIPIVCFNPKIISVSQETNILEEGCLTYPFLYVKIKRPAFIRFRYTNEYGETKTEKFIGISARCIQHECDHLNGINYLRRANVALIQRAKRNQHKIKKRLKAVPNDVFNQKASVVENEEKQINLN